MDFEPNVGDQVARCGARLILTAYKPSIKILKSIKRYIAKICRARACMNYYKAGTVSDAMLPSINTMMADSCIA